MPVKLLCGHDHTEAEILSASSLIQRAAAIAKGKLGGRPRKSRRCACGEMTAKRAKARGHRCEAAIKGAM